MRFRVVVIVVILGSIIGIFGARLIASHTRIVPEEAPIVALKKTIKEVVTRKKPALIITKERDDPAIDETSGAVRVVKATACTTTPKQQEDLRSLGLDPCLTVPINVR